MTNNMEEIPFNQINSALLWLLQHQIINEEQYHKLQGYYKRTSFYNVDELRNELFRLGTDREFLANKITEIENSANNTQNIYGNDIIHLNNQTYNNINFQNSTNDLQYQNNIYTNNTEANAGETFGKQKKLGAYGGISWTGDDSNQMSTSSASQNDSRAAFTNILFFIFLAGLSVGAISMVILKFFIK